MGLDGVELVMAWEDAFGIQITDADAGSIRTPRQAIDLIHAKLNKALSGISLQGETHCITQRGFYLLRRALAPLVSIPRRDITPGSQLADLMPMPVRKKTWKAFQVAVDFARLPELKRPAWCCWLLGGIFVGTYAFSLADLYMAHLNPWWISWLASSQLAIIVCGILAGVVLKLGFYVTRPFRTEFPLKTFGDLTKYAVAHSPLKIKPPDRSLSREDVAVIVREIITDQLGIKDFSDDADFVRDLHLD